MLSLAIMWQAGPLASPQIPMPLLRLPQRRFGKLPQCRVVRQVGRGGREGEIRWLKKSVGAFTLMHLPHVCMENP